MFKTIEKVKKNLWLSEFWSFGQIHHLSFSNKLIHYF